MEYKIEWAKEQVKLFEIQAKGFGWDAIQARHKLKHIKALSKEEFEEAAILSYDTAHGTTV